MSDTTNKFSPEVRERAVRLVLYNEGQHGVRKDWRKLRREGFDGARCTVARQMKVMGIQGMIRGKPHKTTIPEKTLPCPLDKVNRQFRVSAPNVLWVSDFTYVATWKGFVHVAFVIDAYARKIVGWRISISSHAGFVLDALEQAVHDRRSVKAMGLVHHSDRLNPPNICRSNTPNGWRMQASNLPWAASVTVCPHL